LAIFDRSAWLGILLSTGPIAVFAHGFVAAGPTTTGALFIIATAAPIMTASWHRLSLNVCDAAFAVLIACVALSLITHAAEVSDRKETALLILTLLAYPAARLSPGLALNGLVVVTSAVTIVGALVTIPALLAQWSALHGKPLVFGQLDSAPTQFATTLAISLIAATSRRLTVRQATWIAIGAAVPTMVFAASMVRFAFLALIATLAIGWLIGPREQCVPTVIIVATVVVAMLAGLATRSSTTAIYLGYAARALGIEPGPSFGSPPYPDATGPMTCATVDLNDSISIRKQLLSDAVSLLPRASLTGIGLDGFLSATCLPGHPVHNSFLQAVVEFGWPAGLALIALVALGLAPNRIAQARTMPSAQFGYCWLIFAALMASMHGRLSRDTMLLLALGFAAALIQQRSPVAEARLPPANSPNTQNWRV
jgi:hypothetical protein